MKNRDLVSPHIEALGSYVPDKPLDEIRRELGLDSVLKLSSNESHLGPSPRAVAAMRQAMEGVFYYPDGGSSGRMLEAIADFHDLPAQEVITANGSNEVLTLLVRTFCEAGVHSAVTFDYGFIIYALICMGHNVKVRRVPMTEGFGFDLQAMAEAVDETTKVVFIANPNNPTGTYAGSAALRTFLRHLPEEVIVVVDEAYVEYVEADDYESALQMRDLRERLIVLRTFSKCYGLAGLRVGYGIAPAKMVARLHRLREPFTCNSLAQVAVPAALGDRDFAEKAVAINKEGRGALESELLGMEELGVRWIDSQTNFLLVDVARDAGQVAEKMLQRGVLVRPMGGYGLSNHLRISLADAEKMKHCARVLRQVLNSQGLFENRP